MVFTKVDGLSFGQILGRLRLADVQILDVDPAYQYGFLIKVLGDRDCVREVIGIEPTLKNVLDPLSGNISGPTRDVYHSKYTGEGTLDRESLLYNVQPWGISGILISIYVESVNI